MRVANLDLLLMFPLFHITDRYTVEWEETSCKKKSQQHRHMYGTTTKGRLKPENLALWGTVPQPSAAEAAAASESHKKSRTDRTQAAKAKQEAKAAHQKQEEDGIQRAAAIREQQDKEAKEQAARQEEEEQQQAQAKKKAQNKPLGDGPANESSMDRFERLSKEVIGGEQQPPQGPKMIQIKVKCPLDKKAGDFMVFANPHMPGTKRTAVIPPDTVPGKFFKAMVPLPVVEKKRAPSCCVCSKLLLDEDDSAPLRTCAHIACTTCHPTLKGKACTLCSSPLPTLDSLHPLPYVQQLDNPAVKEALLEEFYIARETIRGSSKHEELEEAAEKTVKAIDKHYRRASIKVHPDRHGEKFLTEFDALTKARDVLRDDALRRSYIAEMLEIVCKVDAGYIAQSHQIWVNRNDPDSQDQSRPKSASQAGRRGATLQLDGGLRFSRLKKPRVVVMDDKKRQVRIYLPVHDGHQFLEYCHGVTILASCGKYGCKSWFVVLLALVSLLLYVYFLFAGNSEQDEIVLTKISKSKLEVLDGDIRYIHYLPCHGIWDIFWCASIIVDGQSHTMPTSTEARVDLRSDARRKMVGRKDALETLAHRRSAEIQSVLRNNRLSGPTDRAQVEERYSVLHPVVAKGSDVQHKLTQIYKNLGELSVSTALSSLQEALAAAEIVKEELESVLQSYGKRDARRTFQRCVADQLERGQAESWVSTVTEEQLAELGGDANRLYQLLIEGKKANSLAFNETTLEAAKQRSDFFTPKQCQILQTRKEVVEALYAAELDIVAAEEKKKAAEELHRRQMEEKANSMEISRGAPVEIKGLKARPELNGSLGTYMGLGQGDRFIVRLDHDGKDIALKAEHFDNWDYATQGPPKNHAKWACNACTFLHGGHLAMLSRCSVCDTPKGTPAQQKESETKSPIDNSTKSTLSNPTKSNPKGGKVEVPSSVQSGKVHAKTVPSENKARVKNPSGNAPAKKKTPNPKGEKITVAPSDVNCKVQPKKVTSNNKSTEKVMEMDVDEDKHEGEKLRCKHGAACATLKRDADVCRFTHTPEEIAFYHPAHPSSIAFSIFREDPTDESPADVGSKGVEGNLPILSNGLQKKDKQQWKCDRGLGCRFLKKSPTACHFFHTPEEIAYHHCGNNGTTKQNDKAASVSSKPKEKKHDRCKNGLDCCKLKKGATACPFFHPPDEILVFHPNYQQFASSPAQAMPQPVLNGKDALAKYEEQSKGNASKGKGEKKPDQCRKGLDCRKLQKDAFSCPFYHPPNEILVYHPNANVPQENLLVTETTFRSGKTSSEDSSPPQKEVSVTEHEILIASSAVGHVVGKSKKRLYSIMKKSGAKVKILRKTDSDGMSTVRLSGTEEAIAKAAEMVIDAALNSTKFSDVRAGPEEISVLSGLSNGDSSMTENQITLVTPISSSCKDGALMAFVQTHQDCLKCPPKHFYEWLKAQDIISLVELVEACKDEDFVHNEMQENGLKGFKRKPFVNAAKAAMKL
jgi:hypothetical protein